MLKYKPTMSNKRIPTKRTMTGASMIEVLITVIILSIGLLGMAGLQLSSIRSTSGSNYQTQASLLANNIIERMRANPTGMDDNRFIAFDSDGFNCDALPSPYCGAYYAAGGHVAAENCNTTEMSDYDLNVWFCGGASADGRQGGVQNALARASATITCIDTEPLSGADVDPCTNGSPHTISINWIGLNPDRRADAAADDAHTFTITMQP